MATALLFSASRLEGGVEKCFSPFCCYCNIGVVKGFLAMQYHLSKVLSGYRREEDEIRKTNNEYRRKDS